MGDPVLKVSHVAEMLGVSAMTVYRMIHEGKIGYVKVSDRSYRIYTSALAEYLRERNDGKPQPGEAQGVA